MKSRGVIMKRYCYKLFCLIMFVSFSHGSGTYAQTDYSTPFTFTITNTGVNRFLSSQWSTITTSWSGNYQGLSYSFTLDKPVISLTNNSIKIILGLNITSSVF